MTSFPLTALVTVATLFVYIWVTLQIGKARRLHHISAPAMTGPDDFNRVIRVHANTMEAMLLFLPSLWLFAAFTNDLYAGVIGLFFPLGRIIYANGYYQAADKRGRGFMIGFLTTIVLLIGALIAIAQQLWLSYNM